MRLPMSNPYIGQNFRDSIIRYPLEPKYRTNFRVFLIRCPIKPKYRTKFRDSLIRFPLKSKYRTNFRDSLIRCPIKSKYRTNFRDSLIRCPIKSSSFQFLVSSPECFYEIYNGIFFYKNVGINMLLKFDEYFYRIPLTHTRMQYL